jgi:hypothetical protein
MATKKNNNLSLPGSLGSLASMVNETQDVKESVPAVEKAEPVTQRPRGRSRKEDKEIKAPANAGTMSQWDRVLELAKQYKEKPADEKKAVIIIDEDIKFLIQRVCTAMGDAMTTKALVSAILRDCLESNKEQVQKILSRSRWL